MKIDFAPDLEKQLRGLRLILENPTLGQLFVARDGEKVIAIVNALISISTAEGGRVLMLEDVIVQSEYRGRGLGRQLVEHVLDWAREQKMTRVTLLADHDNRPALKFYDKLGFAASRMTVMRKTRL